MKPENNLQNGFKFKINYALQKHVILKAQKKAVGIFNFFIHAKHSCIVRIFFLNHKMYLI